MKQLLILLILVVIMGCGTQIEPVYQKPINKSYLQLLHNKERAQKDVPQLMLGDDLEEFAQKHAEWMASHGRLKHSDLNFDYRSRGENIAYNQQNEEAVTKAWMNSTGHRRNIMNPSFTHVGFGCAKTKNGNPYWCAVFGGN